MTHNKLKKEHIKRKHQDIKKRYMALKGLRVEGMELEHKDIIKKIAFEFYMSEFSVRLIIAR